MSLQMTDEQLDREIRGFMAAEIEAFSGAPSASEMAVGLTSRVATTTVGLRHGPRLIWLLLVGLLTVALAGAALAGASLLRGDHARAYEAVFLRFDAADLLVVGLDADGREREVTRLAGARLGAGPPIAVVSPSGLLAVAVPEPDNDWMVHWEVIDLHRPEVAPIVIPGIEQDVEQLQPTPYYRTDRRPGMFWGPNDQLAIPWYERVPSGIVDYQVAFVDGRSGAMISADLPDDVKVLPYWAADGSGVVVGRNDEDPPVQLAILRPDGTVTEGITRLAPSASSRRYRSDGAVVSLSRGRIVEGGASVLGLPSGNDAVWTAEGDGLWLVAPAVNGGLLLMVDRFPLSDPVVMAVLPDDRNDSIGSRLRGDLVGLAPDDSMVVASLDRITGTESDGGIDGVSAVRLVSLEGASSVEVEGSFAGWMEVER